MDTFPPDLSLATSAHTAYIRSLDTRRDEYDYWLTEHLRLSGVYWGLTALHLLNRPEALPRDETVKFVLSCWHPGSGGFGAAPGHDAHMLYTVSAVQILVIVDALDELEKGGEGGSGGKMRVGKCEYTAIMLILMFSSSPSVEVFSFCRLLSTLLGDGLLMRGLSVQLSRTFKTEKSAHLLAMSGAKRTRASCTAL